MKRHNGGFAIIEMLIAAAILSTVLISLISGVSAGILAIQGGKGLTRAMLIAKSRMNDFIALDMRGSDIDGEQVAGYDGYTFSRTVSRYESEIFGPLTVRRVEITVRWKEQQRERKYSLSYIYPER